jgi:hypothetical protein
MRRVASALLHRVAAAVQREFVAAPVAVGRREMVGGQSHPLTLWYKFVPQNDQHRPRADYLISNNHLAEIPARWFR